MNRAHNFHNQYEYQKIFDRLTQQHHDQLFVLQSIAGDPQYIVIAKRILNRAIRISIGIKQMDPNPPEQNKEYAGTVGRLEWISNAADGMENHLRHV